MPSGIRTRTSFIHIPSFVGGGAAYQGIGDITPAVAFYGLRAYSATSLSAGTNVVNLANNGPMQPQLAFQASGTSSGFVNTSSVAGWLAATLGTVASVFNLYEQVGGAATDINGQQSFSVSPVWNGNGVASSVPSIGFSTAAPGPQFLRTISLPFTQAQPCTIAAVVKRSTVGSTGERLCIAWSDVAGSQLAFNAGGSNPNSVYSYGGTTKLSAAATDNQFHSVIAVYNGINSTVTVDGITTASSTSIGSGTMFSSGNQWHVGIYVDEVTEPFGGSICEVAVISGAVSAGTITSIFNNHTKAYGTFPI